MEPARSTITSAVDSLIDLWRVTSFAFWSSNARHGQCVRQAHGVTRPDLVCTKKAISLVSSRKCHCPMRCSVIKPIVDDAKSLVQHVWTIEVYIHVFISFCFCKTIGQCLDHLKSNRSNFIRRGTYFGGMTGKAKRERGSYFLGIRGFTNHGARSAAWLWSSTRGS